MVLGIKSCVIGFGSKNILYFFCAKALGANLLFNVKNCYNLLELCYCTTGCETVPKTLSFPSLACVFALILEFDVNDSFVPESLYSQCSHTCHFCPYWAT